MQREILLSLLTLPQSVVSANAVNVKGLTNVHLMSISYITVRVRMSKAKLKMMIQVHCDLTGFYYNSTCVA